MELKKSIKHLKISYILQIIFLIIIIILNIFYYKRTELINEILKIIFYVLVSFLFVMIFIIFIFLIIIIFKNNYDIIFKLLKISSTLFVVQLIIDCGLFIIYIINDNNLKKYYLYCPFNFQQSDLISIFPYLNYNNNDTMNYQIKNKCLLKKCIELNKIGKKYSYICNFDSEKKDDIECHKMNNNSYEDNISDIIISYINLCNSYIDFYICYLSNEPKEFSIGSDYICPDKKEKSFFLEIILTILNFIFPISIYIIQFLYYKRILKLIVTQEIQRHNINNNNTIDSSEKIDKSNKSNKTFKKEKTEVIIIDDNDNYKEQNIIQIMQKNKDDNKKKLIKIYKKEIISINKTKKLFENKNKLNMKEIVNKSFTKDNNTFNYKDKNYEYNTIRLLTEFNKSKNEEKEEKEEKEKINCIIIK